MEPFTLGHWSDSSQSQQWTKSHYHLRMGLCSFKMSWWLEPVSFEARVISTFTTDNLLVQSQLRRLNFWPMDQSLQVRGEACSSSIKNVCQLFFLCRKVEEFLFQRYSSPLYSWRACMKKRIKNLCDCIAKLLLRKLCEKERMLSCLLALIVLWEWMHPD